MNNHLELSEAKLNPDRFLSSRLGDKDRLHMELWQVWPIEFIIIIVVAFQTEIKFVDLII